MFVLIGLIEIAVVLLVIIGGWKMFVKAGQPGWGIIIPIYNVYLMLKIAGRPGWWLILYLIPIVNFIIAIIVSLDVAKAFGKSAVFGILGLFLFAFIGVPILGFGSAVYNSPAPTAAPVPQTA